MTTGLVDCVAESSTQAPKQGRVSLKGSWQIGLHILSVVARLPAPDNNGNIYDAKRWLTVLN